MSSSNGITDGNLPDNHDVLITLAAIIGAIWTVLVIAIRIYIRLYLNGPFGLDDAVAVFGTVVGVCQTAITLYAVRTGIGRGTDSLTSNQINNAFKTLYVSSILYVVAICASKCSMSILITRLTRHTNRRVASRVVTVFVVVWGTVAVLLVVFQCQLPQSWNIAAPGRCSGLLARWVIVETFSMVTNILITILSVILVSNLVAPLKSKVKVVGAFSPQILILVPTTFRLILLRDLSSSSDLTLDYTNTVIATQVVMHFSLMAATFPCMRQFLLAFDSSMVTSAKSVAGTRTDSISGTHQLASVNTREALQPGKQEIRLRPEQISTTTSVTAPARQAQPSETRSIASDGSDQAIIRKTQQWDVSHEVPE